MPFCGVRSAVPVASVAAMVAAAVALRPVLAPTRQATVGAAAQQHLIDIDADEARVPLPSYCGGVLNGSIARHRTAVPPRTAAVPTSW